MIQKIPSSFKQLTSQFNTLFFIHIPKTGGSYVLKKALKHEIVNVMERKERFISAISRLCTIGGTPARFLPSLLQKRIYYIRHPVCTSKPLDIGRFPRAWRHTCAHSKHFKNSLVFTIVRNPFDLLVSFYSYGFPYRRPRPGKPRPWLDAIGFPFSSFDEFIRAYCNCDYPWLVKYQQKFLFFQLFGDDSICQCHLILKNECLDEGLQILCEPFGIKPFSSEGRIKSSRKPSERNYKQFYNDELRELVETKCRRELEAFGYSFEGHDGRVIIDPKNIRYNPHTDEASIT